VQRRRFPNLTSNPYIKEELTFGSEVRIVSVMNIVKVINCDEVHFLAFFHF